MASIVKVPLDQNFDYTYVAFSFNGKNSYDDFGIYRTSDGSQYSTPLVPELNEKTADSIGNDGMYYFKTFHKKISFNIKFAFDRLTEQKLREMKQWLNGKEMGDLWFCETPYKVYTAKVTGTPQLSVLPFEEMIDGVAKRVYKGTGSVQFVCYWPYAHTPDFIAFRSNGEYTTEYIEQDAQGVQTKRETDGRVKKHFDYFPASVRAEWSDIIANFPTTHSDVCIGENPGDLPAPFVLTASSPVSGNVFKVGNSLITLLETCSGNFKWDSKTGLVTGTPFNGTTIRPLNFSGNPIGAIPVGGIPSSEISYPEGLGTKLSYNYWYY